MQANLAYFPLLSWEPDVPFRLTDRSVRLGVKTLKENAESTNDSPGKHILKNLGAKMAQWAKYLSRKYEDVSSNLQSSLKRWVQ